MDNYPVWIEFGDLLRNFLIIGLVAVFFMVLPVFFFFSAEVPTQE